MYKCPNCAGNLTFDIAGQQLSCAYCGTQADPYEVSQEKDAEEKESPSGEYEVTVLFRGIYMPYWVYSFEKKERIMFPGRQNYRRGDYRITDHYQLDCQVDAEYEGLAYDASSTFFDSLSGAIAPFDWKQKKAFTPSFLSGFYADTSDVTEDVYLPADQKRYLLGSLIGQKNGPQREGK